MAGNEEITRLCEEFRKAYIGSIKAIRAMFRLSRKIPELSRIRAQELCCSDDTAQQLGDDELTKNIMLGCDSLLTKLIGPSSENEYDAGLSDVRLTSGESDTLTDVFTAYVNRNVCKAMLI